jgi:Phosphotransferase enzyme family
LYIKLQDLSSPWSCSPRLAKVISSHLELSAAPIIRSASGQIYNMPEVQSLEKIAEGREAEMFAWGDGKILRLLRSGFSPVALDNEVRALGLAHGCGVPVPQPGERADVDGRSGVVLQRIEGTDLLTELGRAPWTVVRAGRMCGVVHAQMHACRVEEGRLPALKQRLGRQLSSSLVPPDLAALARERLQTLLDGDALCHGDFHPANVMRSPKGPVVIDWPNAMRGAPEGDVARTLLLLGAGEPQNPSAMMRVLTKVGRSLFIWLYLGSYKRTRPLDKTEVRRWALPITVGRLAEDIDEERERLLRRIEKLRVSA